MDPRSDLPGLRPPAFGDRVSLTWRADLGPLSRLDGLADHLRDLDTAVGLGERWGASLTQHDERRHLLYRVSREGTRFLEREATQLGYRQRDLFALDEWLEMGFFRPRSARFPFAYPTDLIETLADARAAHVMGTPIDVVRAEYRNPFEIVLAGSGFLLLGAIYVLKLIRDWSHIRRVGAAQAEQAESNARRATTHAEFSQWLVDEARQGRLSVPPHELVGRSPEPRFGRSTDSRTTTSGFSSPRGPILVRSTTASRQLPRIRRCK